jgi:hypothetical protein
MRGSPNSRPCNLDVDTESGNVAVQGEATRSEGLNRDDTTCRPSKGACKGSTAQTGTAEVVNVSSRVGCEPEIHPYKSQVAGHHQPLG